MDLLNIRSGRVGGQLEDGRRQLDLPLKNRESNLELEIDSRSSCWQKWYQTTTDCRVETIIQSGVEHRKSTGNQRCCWMGWSFAFIQIYDKLHQEQHVLDPTILFQHALPDSKLPWSSMSPIEQQIPSILRLGSLLPSFLLLILWKDSLKNEITLFIHGM